MILLIVFRMQRRSTKESGYLPAKLKANQESSNIKKFRIQSQWERSCSEPCIAGYVSENTDVRLELAVPRLIANQRSETLGGQFFERGSRSRTSAITSVTIEPRQIVESACQIELECKKDCPGLALGSAGVCARLYRSISYRRDLLFEKEL